MLHRARGRDYDHVRVNEAYYANDHELVFRCYGSGNLEMSLDPGRRSEEHRSNAKAWKSP